LFIDGYYAQKTLAQLGVDPAAMFTHLPALLETRFRTDSSYNNAAYKISQKYFYDCAGNDAAASSANNERYKALVGAARRAGFQIEDHYRYKLQTKAGLDADGKMHTVSFWTQAEVDVAIAVAITQALSAKANPVDDIILLAGDIDFRPVIKHAAVKDKGFIVLGSKGNTSFDLQTAGQHRFWDLGEFVESKAEKLPLAAAPAATPAPRPRLALAPAPASGPAPASAAGRASATSWRADKPGRVPVRASASAPAKREEKVAPVASAASKPFRVGRNPQSAMNEPAREHASISFRDKGDMLCVYGPRCNRRSSCPYSHDLDDLPQKCNRGASCIYYWCYGTHPGSRLRCCTESCNEPECPYIHPPK
jgi:uncharacterized LabA/DUF88 family protein